MRKGFFFFLKSEYKFGFQKKKRRGFEEGVNIWDIEYIKTHQIRPTAVPQQ
jgi:hypothetical protein